MCTLLSQGWSKLKQVLINEVPAGSGAVAVAPKQPCSRWVCLQGRQAACGHASAAFHILHRAAKMRKGLSPKHRANQCLLQQQLWFPSINLPEGGSDSSTRTKLV